MKKKLAVLIIGKQNWGKTTTINYFDLVCDERDKLKKLPVDVILGEGSPDLTDGDKAAFRQCAHASKEALDKKDEYFASYYWTKEIEGTQTWMIRCDGRGWSIPNNIIKGFTDSDGKFVPFAHNFRRICEVDEVEYLNLPESPYATKKSLRPQVNPRREKDSIN